MPYSTGRPARGARVTPPARLLSGRHDLMNVLILGGSPEERLAVASAVHRDSRPGGGSLVAVDARQDDGRVRRGLEAWISDRGAETEDDFLRFSDLGTLFVDSIASLSVETQRLMLAFTRRLADRFFDDSETSWFGRLAVGETRGLPAAVAQGRFSTALYDALDKVRIELPRRGANAPNETRTCPRESVRHDRSPSIRRMSVL